MDEGKEFKFTLLDALHIARRAWSQVSKSKIRNCLSKAKFIEEKIQTEVQVAELLDICEALTAKKEMHENEEIEMSDFLKANERITTCGPFTLAEITEDMLFDEEPVVSKDGHITVEKEVVLFEEAQCAWSTVRKFML